MLNIYEDNGYIDMEKLIKLKGIWLLIIIGARGIGKTYGVCKYLIKHDDAVMMLIRRTVTQIELINIPEFSPLTKPAEDLGFGFTMKRLAKNYSGIYTLDEPPRLLAYTAAMSTFSNIRGFDASDVNFIFYDEFQPERGERDIKNEGEKFLNLYETVNRNRELDGKPPVKAILASNANDINSPILRELDLVDVCARMQERGQEVYMNTARGIAVIMPQYSEISKKKANTALYRAVKKNGDFAQMALNNAFDEVYDIKTYPLVEFNPVARIKNINIYQHKSRKFIYISAHAAGSCMEFDDNGGSLRQFLRYFDWLYDVYMGGDMIFESLQIKQEFEKIIF